MVVMEGRRPLCGSCKLLGHLSRTCPQNSTVINNSNTNNSNPGKTTNPPALEPEVHPNKTGRRVDPSDQKREKTIHKKTEPTTEATAKATTTETTAKKTAAAKPEPTEPATSITSQKIKKKVKKKNTEGEQPVSSFGWVTVYVPNIAAERVFFFRRLASFLYDTKRIVFMGDWNAILDPKIDRAGKGVRGSGRLTMT